MSDLADIANLLGIAEKLLRDNVITNSPQETRFSSLMVASAIGMAERSLTLAQERAAASRDVAALAPVPNPFASDSEALVHLIRSGVMDCDDEAYRRLLVDAIIRTTVTKPALVTTKECRLAGLEE